jgi:uncharacterized protein YggE
MAMKQRGWQIMTLTLAVLVIGWLGFGRGEGAIVSAQTGDAPSATVNTVTVGASGTIKVEPDVAYVNVAVQTRAATAKAAQQANADQFAAVEKTLKDKFAIEGKDIQTTGFYVQPEYNYTEKDGQKLTGYTSVHQLQITYRKLTDIGSLLDAVSASGVNQISGVQFSTEKQDQYELDALKKAMGNAAAKANVLATAGNRKLGSVLNITQGAVSPAPIIYSSGYAEAKSMAPAAASTSVQVGQIEVTANVTVQYQLQ